MENANIDLVFDELKRMGQCQSRSDFSLNWLGRNESYFRSIQSKGQRPSVQAQVNLAARLRYLGMCFGTSKYPAVVTIGETYLKPYGELLDALLTGTHSGANNSLA
jgi:hypothetical protein